LGQLLAGSKLATNHGPLAIKKFIPGSGGRMSGYHASM